MTLKSPADHIVFSPIVETFFKEQLGARLTPAMKAQIKAVGIDLSKPLHPAYPVATFEDAMAIVAREVLTHLTFRDAFVEMGRMQIRAFGETLLGRATMPVFRLLVRDHDRVMKTLTRGFRQANNYVETRVERLGPGHYRVWFNDAGQYPEVFQGLLEAGGEMLGVPCEVRIDQREGLACWYEVRARSSA